MIKPKRIAYFVQIRHVYTGTDYSRVIWQYDLQIAMARCLRPHERAGHTMRVVEARLATDDEIVAQRARVAAALKGE